MEKIPHTPPLRASKKYPSASNWLRFPEKSMAGNSFSHRRVRSGQQADYWDHKKIHVVGDDEKRCQQVV